MEESVVTSLLDLGGLGVAIAVLVLVGRWMFQRQGDASKVIEEIARVAISRMDELVRDSNKAQRATAEAMIRLTGEVERGRTEAGAEHARIREMLAQVGGKEQAGG